MPAVHYLVAAAIMMMLGVACPNPWGVPYFALTIILSALAIRDMWRKRK